MEKKEFHNLREITNKEFAESNFFQYPPREMPDYQLITPGYSECPEIQWLGDPITTQFTLFYFDSFDGTGVAMVSDHYRDPDVTDHWVNGVYQYPYKNRVRFFAYGCDHKYSELTSAQCRERDLYHAGSCYHVYECEHCGHIMAQDSSD